MSYSSKSTPHFNENELINDSNSVPSAISNSNRVPSAISSEKLIFTFQEMSQFCNDDLAQNVLMTKQLKNCSDVWTSIFPYNIEICTTDMQIYKIQSFVSHVSIQYLPDYYEIVPLKW